MITYLSREMSASVFLQQNRSWPRVRTPSSLRYSYINAVPTNISHLWLREPHRTLCLFDEGEQGAILGGGTLKKHYAPSDLRNNRIKTVSLYA